MDKNLFHVDEIEYLVSKEIFNAPLDFVPNNKIIEIIDKIKIVAMLITAHL